jgi:hypothetical protein
MWALGLHGAALASVRHEPELRESTQDLLPAVNNPAYGSGEVRIHQSLSSFTRRPGLLSVA